MADKLGRSELYNPSSPLGQKGMESAREGEREEGGRDDKAFQSDGVAALLLAAHCCLLSFSFFACSDTDRDRNTAFQTDVC